MNGHTVWIFSFYRFYTDTFYSENMQFSDLGLLEWSISRAKQVYLDLNIIQRISQCQLNENLVLLFFVWQSDRFIPAREPMDFDVARFMITQKEKEKENGDTPYPSPSKKAYKKEMAATLLKNANAADNNCRIFSFKGKSSTASQASQQYASVNLPVTKRARRYIPPVKLGFHIFIRHSITRSSVPLMFIRYWTKPPLIIFGFVWEMACACYPIWMNVLQSFFFSTCNAEFATTSIPIS